MSKRSRRKHKVKKGRDRAFLPIKESPHLDDLVPHPRYGKTPRPSGHGKPDHELLAACWNGGDGDLLLDTAIPANIEKQNFVALPRMYYVDILKHCRKCGRRFIFFAREQQYWYEELKFYIYADCVLCPECRKSHQQVRRRFQRYSKLAAKKKWTDDELKQMVSDVVFLWEQGILRKVHVLRRYRNLAMKGCPTAKAAYDIDILVRNLPKK